MVDSKFVVSDVSIRSSDSNQASSSLGSLMKMTLELASNETINSHGINNVKSTFRLGSMIIPQPKARPLKNDIVGYRNCEVAGGATSSYNWKKKRVN